MKQQSGVNLDATGTSVLMGLSALFAAFWNLQIVVLVIFTVVAGLFDMMFGARRAALQERENQRQLHLFGEGDASPVYDGKKLNEGAFGKLLWLVLYIFLGATGDVFFQLFSSVLPGAEALSKLAALTPFTVVALVYRFQHELGSIVRNIETTPGVSEDDIWPGFRKLLKKLKVITDVGTDDPSS